VNWTYLPDEAVDDLIGRLGNGSSLKELLEKLGPSPSQATAQGLVDGLTKGSHPTVISREIRDALGGDLQRALAISRTEVLRCYRGASQRAYQANDDLVKGWIWYAEIGSCCTACFAMHGTLHDLSEELDGHVNCRCSMVPVTKDWGELGFLDMDDAEAPTDAIEEGADLWEDQPEARQLDLFGERGLAAMRNGDLEMSDWVQVRDSEAWGSSRTTATYKQALANAARRTGGG
jgi:SPP1 gp7 family putative phage head morphogenesis protein